MDWSEARMEWETNPNVTQGEIAEAVGVSQQAVSQRIKREGWEKADNELVKVVEDLPLLTESDYENLGKRTPENLAKIVSVFAVSGNKKLAANSVGVDRDTLLRWCKKDPEFTALMAARRNSFLAQQFDKIAHAKDWKAASKILEKAPETREQWGEQHQEGPTIILNINRSG